MIRKQGQMTPDNPLDGFDLTFYGEEGEPLTFDQKQQLRRTLMWSYDHLDEARVRRRIPHKRRGHPMLANTILGLAFIGLSLWNYALADSYYRHGIYHWFYVVFGVVWTVVGANYLEKAWKILRDGRDN